MREALSPAGPPGGAGGPGAPLERAPTLSDSVRARGSRLKLSVLGRALDGVESEPGRPGPTGEVPVASRSRFRRVEIFLGLEESAGSGAHPFPTRRSLVITRSRGGVCIREVSSAERIIRRGGSPGRDPENFPSPAPTTQAPDLSRGATPGSPVRPRNPGRQARRKVSKSPDEYAGRGTLGGLWHGVPRLKAGSAERSVRTRYAVSVHGYGVRLS